MSYLVLARKYRPQIFEDVIGQNHVTRTLVNAITNKRVAHAILFAGPRGTGKTTLARILAKAMNCESGPTPTPCNNCRSCKDITAGNSADVFEIDGASNNGVDHIRDLRENIKYMPAYSRYKIYIIDEVHMLSTPAFNALLKTLEEPPDHILFLFATTEPKKIPITILSRCQRHDLRRVDIKAVSAHLKKLCALEKIRIPDESLDLIAKEGEGSIRDALSLLDQVMTCAEQGSISHEKITELLGIADRRVLFDISSAVINGDIAKLLEIIDNIYNHGHNIQDVYIACTEHFRNLLFVKMGNKTASVVDAPDHEIRMMKEQAAKVPDLYLNQILSVLMEEEVSVKLSTQPRIAMEMAFIRLFQIRPAISIETLIKKIDDLKKGLPEAEVFPGPAIPAINIPQIRETASLGFQETRPEKKDKKPLIEPVKNEKPLAEKEISLPAKGPVYNPGDSPEKTWQAISAIINEKSPSLGSCLNQCVLKNITGEAIEIEVSGNGFCFKQIKRKERLILEICENFFNKKMRLIVHEGKALENSPKNKAKTENQIRNQALNHPAVEAALEIFGGKIIEVKTLKNTQD